MRKPGHNLLLVAGLGVSFIAYLLLWDKTPAQSLRDLAQPLAGPTLLFEFSPFIALAALVQVARSCEWREAALRASTFTGNVVSLLSIAGYALLVVASLLMGGEWGHPGPALLLWVLPSWSWCAIAVLWPLAWWICSFRKNGRGGEI